MSCDYTLGVVGFGLEKVTHIFLFRLHSISLNYRLTLKLDKTTIAGTRKTYWMQIIKKSMCLWMYATQIIKPDKRVLNEPVDIETYVDTCYRYITY